MKLADLTRGLELTLLQGTEDKDVKALIYFSEEAVPGCLFFAVPGTEKNGLDYAEDAVRRGASAVVVQEPWFPPQNLSAETTVILAEDVRQTMAFMSCRFYGEPCRELTVIGVTGTKGKTSTAFMLREILEQAGISAGIIGTVKNGWEGNFQEADRTTPQPVDIQCWCRKMADAGCSALVMEVSSQGLKQHRTGGVDFDIGMFTNLSPDHIGPGEHASFEEYASCKGKLFQQCRTAVYSEDDEKWKELLPPGSSPRRITFGQNPRADYWCRDVKLQEEDGMPGIQFTLERGTERAELQVPLPGNFNAVNAAGAAAAARTLGIGWNPIKEALKQIRIPGRMEPVNTGGRTRVFVDYAHNGISLRRALESLRQYEPERLIVVFGCGGNRDRNRRREMGRTAAELADLTIVTSDNPRQENPAEIIKDITDAMDGAIAGGAPGRYRVEPDRKAAIIYAVTNGRKRDMILIAGKGHETYQLVNGKKIYFDDRKTAEEAAQKAGRIFKHKIMGEKET